MTCGRCTGTTRRLIQQTDGSLVCPDCSRELAGAQWGQLHIQRDEIPGGITLENYGPAPVTFYSHSERRRYMAAHGLQEKESFCPLPGTDKDPQGIPNPNGYVDDYTRQAREALFLRAHNAGGQEFDAETSGVLGARFSGTLTERDAVAVGSGDSRRASRVGRRIANAG